MENKFSAENAMIPDEIPLELQNLTFLEEMLISKQISRMHIARLRWGGQFWIQKACYLLPSRPYELDPITSSPNQ